MKYLILILSTITCLSCGDVEQRSISRDQSYIDGMTFYKKSGTNLCFMAKWIGFSEGMVTYVPCTPEVEAAIKNNNVSYFNK